MEFSDSQSGFYIGVVADFTLTEVFHIQPELAYGSIDGGDGIFLPIMGKYYVADKQNLQAGPQLVFTLEDVPQDFTGVEFDLAAGLGFDITEAFFAEARYAFQLNNSYTGNEDITARASYLNVGIGYKF